MRSVIPCSGEATNTGADSVAATDEQANPCIARMVRSHHEAEFTHRDHEHEIPEALTLTLSREERGDSLALATGHPLGPSPPGRGSG